MPAPGAPNPSPRFALLYTSARPERVAGVVELWLVRAHDAARVETIVCVDAPDEAAARRALARVAQSGVRLVLNSGPRTCVAGWNEAARHADADVLIAVSDDYEPPAGWDAALAAAGPEGWWRRDHVVAVREGYVSDVFTLVIMTASRYARFGYVYHPDYASMYCDAEFTAVALRDSAVLDARHLLFPHHHHFIGKRVQDAVDRRHSSQERWLHGRRVFLARQRDDFPRETRTATPVAVVGEVRCALYVQAIRDDFCLFEVCQRILEEQRPGSHVVGAVFLCAPDEYWSGRATPPEDVAAVEAAAGRLRAAWPQVDVRMVRQHVAPLRVAARSRIEVETRARNAALAMVRQAGYQHVLVADSDELWRRGLFATLAELIRAEGPPGVVTGMVPVLGLPGYPVDRARDQVTIYLDAHAVLVNCREICGVRHDLPGHPVIHFTATRRTMEEIIRKHRESGHYDDPDYDFEGWIANVLPRIRPGLTNAHMFTRFQVWPKVRRWREEEWAELPESVRPYMGSQLRRGHWARRLWRAMRARRQAGAGAP
jgi:hypothetical protein